METASRHGMKAHATRITAQALKEAARDAFAKLAPRTAMKNPVMFVVLVGTVLTAALSLHALSQGQAWGYAMAVALILFATVLFANFAEAVAEARGRGQAARRLAAWPRPRASATASAKFANNTVANRINATAIA